MPAAYVGGGPDRGGIRSLADDCTSEKKQRTTTTTERWYLACIQIGRACSCGYHRQLDHRCEVVGDRGQQNSQIPVFVCCRMRCWPRGRDGGVSPCWPDATTWAGCSGHCCSRCGSPEAPQTVHRS